MPFYEYECSACGRQAEALQKISDAPLKKCPHCGKSALKRLISAPVFRLKGNGWYETDFKSDQDRKRNLVGHDEAPAAKEDDAKAVAKPDAQTESKEKPAAAEPKPAASKKPAARHKPVAKPKPAAKPTAKTIAKPSAKKKAAGRR